MREAVELVRENCRSHGIDAALGADGEISLAHLESRMEELKEERDFIATTFGEKMELLTRTDLMERGLWGPTFHGGLFSSTGFGIHPLRYARGLARAAVKAGATIHPHSPVTRWREENDWHILETPQGRLRARQVIVATNGFTQEEILTPLEGRLLPALSSIIVTRPLSEEECRLQGWTSTVMAYDTRNLLHYFRLLPDRRFLFGGRGGTDSAASGEAPLRDLMTQSLREMFPAWVKAEITHFWRGFVCLTYDLLPYVGALNERKTVWTAIAYHGNGVALASWSGRALARLMAGNGKAANLPAPMAHRLKRFPLPALRPFYLKGAYLWYGFNDSR
jgi:glycine/D-amino acid oxidase-like deaminating enzyme